MKPAEVQAQASPMSIVLNPQRLPSRRLAAQGVAADVVLQPGTVINAQVLQLLGNDQVQIAIGGQSLDVTSQVPLQAGQTLQLAVSQAADGNINLAVVNQPANASGQARPIPPPSNATSDAVTLAAARQGRAGQARPAPQNQLTALQALAVSVAAETAAAAADHPGAAFANLGVAAASGSLPALVQQAAAQVLAQRTSLDQDLTGADIKQAFQEFRPVSGSVAGAGLGLVGHARPQGGADRAAPGADHGDR